MWAACSCRDSIIPHKKVAQSQILGQNKGPANDPPGLMWFYFALSSFFTVIVILSYVLLFHLFLLAALAFPPILAAPFIFRFLVAFALRRPVEYTPACSGLLPPLLLLFFRHPLLMALIQFARIFRYIVLLQLFLLRLPTFFVPSLCVFLIIAHLYYTPQYTFYTNYATLYSVVLCSSLNYTP